MALPEPEGRSPNRREACLGSNRAESEFGAPMVWFLAPEPMKTQQAACREPLGRGCRKEAHFSPPESQSLLPFVSAGSWEKGLRVCTKINSGFAGGDFAFWRGTTKEHSQGSATESVSENCAGSCGEGFWLWPRRRGLSIPNAGCKDRANAGHGQKTRRPEGFRAKGRLASLLLSRRSREDILLRCASPSGLWRENRTPRNFRTRSEEKRSQKAKSPQPSGAGPGRLRRCSSVTAPKRGCSLLAPCIRPGGAPAKTGSYFCTDPWGKRQSPGPVR